MVNLATYIENNKNKMDYRLYESNGWFVGSGAIESSNKIVAQRRLDGVWLCSWLLKANLSYLLWGTI